MQETGKEFDVIIAGAGPVGLCLAIDLGRRGVRTLLLERNETTAPWPKMDRCNGRTMEMFRRLGIADKIRALGYPSDNPMDVFLLRTLAEEPLATLRYQSVDETRAVIAARRDGSLTCEPYQLVSQNAVEPFLKDLAEATPNVDVRYGHEVLGFTQDDFGVTVKVAGGRSFDASYLVGCDGGRSVIRKELGIELTGQGGLRDLTQVIFWSEDLYESIPSGKGRHYCLPLGCSFTAQGNRKEFTFHNPYPADSDFKRIIADAIGFPCDFTITQVVPWRHHLLLADRYRDRRVMIAGDAAHLVIPTGGLGMNTGVGDAFDLSWKLAGTVQGWGGPGLLDSYEAERRPVAARNIEASGWAARSVIKWGVLFQPVVHEDTPMGQMKRRRLTEAFAEYHSRMYGPEGYGMIGVEYGYSYAWSPIVADEPNNVPEWQISTYHPHARPGVRLPHMWLDDGTPIQDSLGDSYTLLDLCGDVDNALIEAAFAAIGAKLETRRFVQEDLRAVYGAEVLILRPDLHVGWRGNSAPADPAAVAKLLTGN
ncbi:FAD-dependent monooxygenase [Novosphingobium sp.]|uniref:FAD-dependent monooxygenase n=1 Tax=Novosphingobium sp. TaxID=1874826 RepID=UPI00262FB871|nr:FAD-dependent monooxygenase [Novosphingobium sp.]